MKILGLTGGIATGKSTVSNYLKTKKIPVVDADVLVHELITNNQELLAQLSATFGTAVFNEQGVLERKRLGEIVFADPKCLVKLNTIMAPYIAQTIKTNLAHWRQQNVPLVVLDAPTLFEAGYAKTVDWVMVVAISKSLQIQRLMQRNHLAKPAALARIGAQMPLTQKIKLADFVIDNSGDIAATYRQIDEILATLKV